MEGVSARDPDLFPGFSRRMPGAAIVCDFDRDSFDDVIVIYNKPDKFGYLEAFKNKQGKRFMPVTRLAGLEKVRDQLSFTMAACADLDNDGWADLVLAGIGQDILILKNKNGRFIAHGRIKASDEIRSLNVFDANEDGFLDIYSVNYRPLDPTDPRATERLIYNQFMTRRVRNTHGAPDKIFLNQGDGAHFMEVPEKSFPQSGTTWAAGIDDFNGDGHADVFLAEDFGMDALFFGTGKGKFLNNSRKSLGKIRSRASMSAEVVDVNGDGLPDIYVSNRPKSGLQRGFNSLWINQPSRPGTFRDRAVELGVDGCGWSWGSQFSDLDQDGWLDLVVVNGMYGSKSSDYWYTLNYEDGSPELSRRNVPPNKEMRASPVTISVDHRKCLFLGRPDGRFRDAAPSVGFADKRIARAVTLFDFDHDGDEDVLMMSPYSGPILYENKLAKPGRWLSVRLEGTKSNATGIGSQLTLRTSQRTMRKTYYPLNGFENQKASDIFFTFRGDERPIELKVEWPSRRVSIRQLGTVNARMVVVES